MRLFIFAVLIAVASAALSPTTYTECPMYLLHTSGNLASPLPNYVPNVIIYNTGAGNLMTGTPQGPYFSAMEGNNCYWIPNGPLNCGLNLWADAAHTIFLGTGMINSTLLIANDTTTAPGFHYVGGSVRLTTQITNLAYISPTPSTNFHDLNLELFFPAMQLMSAGGNPFANGVSTVGGVEYLTLWGSNGWNGTTWDASSRTTGFDIRVSLECTSGNTGHNVPCPTCPGGVVVVPSACNANHLPISQSVPGNCMVMTWSSSSSTSSGNGCVGGSL